jgi:hypothetical protein
VTAVKGDVTVELDVGTKAVIVVVAVIEAGTGPVVVAAVVIWTGPVVVALIAIGPVVATAGLVASAQVVKMQRGGGSSPMHGGAL